MLRSHGIALLCVTAELASGRVCCLFTSPLFSNDRLRLRRSVLQFGLPVRCASDRPRRRSLEFGVPRRPRYSLRGRDAHGCTFPVYGSWPAGNVPDPSTQIVHIPAVSRTPIIPTPFQNEFPASPSPSQGATVQVCGPPCNSSGLPLALDYPRGSRGLELAGSEREVPF